MVDGTNAEDCETVGTNGDDCQPFRRNTDDLFARLLIEVCM